MSNNPTDTATATTTAELPNNQLALGISLNLLAFFCFAVMDTSAKWLAMMGVVAVQVTFLRYFFHLLWVVILYVPREGLSIFRSGKPQWQALRALFLLGATFFNFAALNYLPLTITIAIFFSSPLIVCLLSIPVLGEKVGLHRLTAVAAGFIGVLVIVAPWNEHFDVHVFLSLAAALCASTYFVLSRKIAGVDRNAVSQAYVAGISTVAMAPLAFALSDWNMSLNTWGVAILLGSLGMLGHSVLTRAHCYVEASVLAPTVYSQILYITFFSWIFFDSPPNQRTIIGTAIIALSGLYLWRRERRLSKVYEEKLVKKAG